MLVPPPNQYQVEKAFYDFISTKCKGFIAAFARWFNYRDDSHASRMHNPDVPEVPCWLYKAAVKLDAAARIDLAAGRHALSILSAVVEAHATREAVSVNGFEATYFDLRSALARREDGLATDADVEDAKARHAEATARVGAGVRVMTQGDLRRETEMSG